MKKSIMVAAALIVAGFAGNAFAQNSATANGTANATIIAPISISSPENNGGALDFGNIVSTSNGGTVSESGGNDNYTGDAGSNPGANNAGTIQDAVFDVTGADNAYFAYSSSSVTGLPAGFSVSLTGADNLSAQLSNTGTYTITVGGTLTVPANAGAQNVSGTWTETAQYN